MSLDVLVRLLANGFSLVALVGVLFFRDVFEISAAALTLVAVLLGMLVEPYLLHHHPFKGRAEAFYAHVRAIVSSELAQAITALGEDEPARRSKLENAFLKTVYEVTLRSDSSSNRLADIVS